MFEPNRVKLAVANQKGGVGKTTTAINLAAALAAGGREIVLVDLDPQGNASTGLGLGPDERRFTSYDLLNEVTPTEPPTPLERLRVIPASPDLAGAEVELVARARREFCLATTLDAWCARHRPAEIFVFDCPPSLSLITINALVAADLVLVPLQCEFFALEGLAQLIRTLDRIRERLNPALELSGILLTMYDRRNSLSELVAADVRSFFGAKVFETVIPRNVRLSEASSHGQPGIIYDPRSPGALAYMALAVEFLKRGHG